MYVHGMFILFHVYFLLFLLFVLHMYYSILIGLLRRNCCWFADRVFPCIIWCSLCYIILGLVSLIFSYIFGVVFESIFPHQEYISLPVKVASIIIIIIINYTYTVTLLHLMFHFEYHTTTNMYQVGNLSAIYSILPLVLIIVSPFG